VIVKLQRLLLRVRGAYIRSREEGLLRSTLVARLLLVLTFGGVFVWGYYLFHHSDPDGDVRQHVLATLVLFVGSYVPVGHTDDPVPPPDVSLAGILALSLTVITAGSILLMSRRVRDFIRIIHPNVTLAVLGDGTSAAAIIQSSIERRISSILITGSRSSESGAATTPLIPVVASGQIQNALSIPSARRVIARTDHVVVVTDSDGLNMRLHQKIRSARQSQATPRSTEHRDWATDVVVIKDPEYAELLRPAAIRGKLPVEEVACPAENIAEHLCHLIVAAATGPHGVNGVAVDIVEVPATGPIDQEVNLTATVHRWVRRLDWMLSFVQGDEGRDEDGQATFETVPDLDLIARGAVPTKDELLIRIYVGVSSSSVATQVFSESGTAALRIAVADMDLIQGAAELRCCQPTERRDVTPGREWLRGGAVMDSEDGRFDPPLVVVDPDDVGLDAALVTDDTGTQWARTFDLTYGLMFANGTWSVTGWLPGAPMGDSTKHAEREARAVALSSGADPAAAARKVHKTIAARYSNKLAVAHMLAVLAARGFELRRQGAEVRPAAPDFSAEDVEYIAEEEHTDWLQRRWTDTSRRRPRTTLVSSYSSSHANQHCYRGLVALESSTDDSTRNLRYAASYNRRIATETYPAIAASFGYSIVRFDDAGPVRRDRRCDKPACACRQHATRADRCADAAVAR
jgi:hypothetical protein